VLWVYVLVGTAGLVALVPTLLRAIDGLDNDLVTTAVGFGCTTFGVVGLILQFAGFSALTTLISAGALGLAAGAVSPEAIAALGQGRSTQDTELAKNND